MSVFKLNCACYTYGDGCFETMKEPGDIIVIIMIPLSYSVCPMLSMLSLNSRNTFFKGLRHSIVVKNCQTEFNPGSSIYYRCYFGQVA